LLVPLRSYIDAADGGKRRCRHRPGISTPVRALSTSCLRRLVSSHWTRLAC